MDKDDLEEKQRQTDAMTRRKPAPAWVQRPICRRQLTKKQRETEKELRDMLYSRGHTE